MTAVCEMTFNSLILILMYHFRKTGLPPYNKAVCSLNSLHNVTFVDQETDQ